VSVADVGSQAIPLTERVLDRLGRPRWLWIGLWACVPLLSPVVFATAIVLSGRQLGVADLIDLVATQAVLAYVVLVFLWGTGELAHQAAALKEGVASFVLGEAPDDLFDSTGSLAGPLILTALAVSAISAGGFLQYGPLPPLAALPLLVVYMAPILTFIWVYLRILVDIDRLGRRPMALDAFPHDRTLGLEKVGSLASTGLGLVLIGAVPVLLAGSDEPVTLGISLVIVAASVGIFLLSMWRLHRQMSAAKARYVAIARDLYARAYEPIRLQASIGRLEEQATILSAAQSLDERAHGLPTWPINESALRFIAVVVTGVLTSMVVRGLFAAIDG
jgi:hypothetical protein